MEPKTETPAQVRQMNSEQIVKIKKQLLEMQRAFQAIKKSGIHEDILIAYLHDKTGSAKADIRNFIYHQGEFYKRLAKLAE